MASQTDPCVADHVLAEFAQGVLDPSALAPLTRHLSHCDSCRRRAALAAGAVSEVASPPSMERTLPDTPSLLQALQLGKQLGRYVVLDALGRGGMGQVFRAYDPQLDRQVALKVLSSTATGERAVAGLLEEARAAGRLVHPNVVTVHDVGEDQGRAFVAMEMVEGGSLAHWLASGRRAPRKIIEVFLGAGEGLAAAHRAGLVHRDFKPTNVLMGGDGRPRVADFGLATATPPPRDPSDAPKTGTTAGGTPGYMAPEQYFRKADARSDEFAFCVSLWEALAGIRPFEAGDGESTLDAIRAGTPAGKLPRSVGRRVRRALLRGLSFNPEDRFLSMEALLADLRSPGSMRLAGATIFLGVALGASVTILAREWHAGPAPGEAGVPQLIEAPRPDASAPANASPPPGVADAAVRVEAAPGKAPASRVRKGRLTLRVSPWAEVSIDGRKLGTTPLSPIELGEGRHSVVLVNPELGVRRTLTATVRDGRDVTLRVNLLE